MPCISHAEPCYATPCHHDTLYAHAMPSMPHHVTKTRMHMACQRRLNCHAMPCHAMPTTAASIKELQRHMPTHLTRAARCRLLQRSQTAAHAPVPPAGWWRRPWGSSGPLAQAAAWHPPDCERWRGGVANRRDGISWTGMSRPHGPPNHHRTSILTTQPTASLSFSSKPTLRT